MPQTGLVAFHSALSEQELLQTACWPGIRGIPLTTCMPRCTLKTASMQCVPRPVQQLSGSAFPTGVVRLAIRVPREQLIVHFTWKCILTSPATRNCVRDYQAPACKLPFERSPHPTGLQADRALWCSGSFVLICHCSDSPDANVAFSLADS